METVFFFLSEYRNKNIIEILLVEMQQTLLIPSKSLHFSLLYL